MRYHIDDESTGLRVDLDAALAAPAEGELLYCCGPDGLMRAVSKRSAHWPQAQVRFEWFSAPVDDTARAADENRPFALVLRRQGRTLDIPANKSILDALEENGVMVPFACREGLCRTCETGVCAGEVDHRDYVLSEVERAAGKTMMICVSRARSPSLEIDL